VRGLRAQLGGRGFHSSTSQLDLSRFRTLLSLNPPNASHKMCSSVVQVIWLIRRPRLLLDTHTHTHTHTLQHTKSAHVKPKSGRVLAPARRRRTRASGGAPDGRAVQVDPIKPVVEALGTKRLILKYDQPLSKFAFKFNLRCYTTADASAAVAIGKAVQVDARLTPR